MSDPLSHVKDPTALLQLRMPRTTSPCDQCKVREHSFCDVLEGQDFARLAAIVAKRAYAARQTIVQEGDPAEWLFNVLSGTVKLYRTLPNGRVQIVGFLGEGDFMGVPAATSYAASAEAITAVDVCMFPRRSFDRLLSESQTLERRLFDLSRNEVAAAHDHMLLLGRKTARERVASFLVSLSTPSQCEHTTAPQIDLPMARTEIADYLGLTMETVSRTFSAFRAEGLITLDTPDSVRLMRVDRLRAIAAADA